MNFLEKDDLLVEREIERNIASLDEVVKAIEQCYKSIPDFHKRILYFTLKNIRIYFHCDCIGNITAEDVVEIAFEKILKGKRKWNKEKFPQFIDFLRVVIFSFIRNEKKRNDRVKEIGYYDVDGEPIIEAYPEYIKVCLEQDFESQLIEDDFETLSSKFLENFKKDEVAYFVLEARLNGNDSNKEIAKKLGIKVREVESALKRIKYVYGKLARGRMDRVMRYE